MAKIPSQVNTETRNKLSKITLKDAQSMLRRLNKLAKKETTFKYTGYPTTPYNADNDNILPDYGYAEKTLQVEVKAWIRRPYCDDIKLIDLGEEPSTRVSLRSIAYLMLLPIEYMPCYMTGTDVQQEIARLRLLEHV